MRIVKGISVIVGLKNIFSPRNTLILFSIPLESNMSAKLWFVTDGSSFVGVFDNRAEAEREEQKYEDDPDYSYYEYYGISVDDLEDHPDEYDYALEKGFLG